MKQLEKIAELNQTIASKNQLVADLEEALGEVIARCPDCNSLLTIVGWNQDVMMRKCVNHSCIHYLAPLRGLKLKRVKEIERLLLGRYFEEGG